MSSECGTYGGYQRHRRNKEPACDSCREASAAYHRAWRESGGKVRGSEQQRARSRAVWRLVDRHRDEFDRLYVEERTRDHIAAIKETK